MTSKFTKREWIDNVHDQFGHYPKIQIKEKVERVIQLLQDVISRGDMVIIPNVGKLIVVEKKPRFGVRNLYDLTQPAFTLPASRRVVFIAQNNYAAINKYTFFKPEYKRYKFADCLKDIDEITQDKALSFAILTVFTDTAHALLSVDAVYTKMEIRGLLVLYQAVAEKRNAINPATGEAISISKKLKIKFKQPKFYADLYSNSNK